MAGRVQDRRRARRRVRAATIIRGRPPARSRACAGWPGRAPRWPAPAAGPEPGVRSVCTPEARTRGSLGVWWRPSRAAKGWTTRPTPRSTARDVDDRHAAAPASRNESLVSASTDRPGRKATAIPTTAPSRQMHSACAPASSSRSAAPRERGKSVRPTGRPPCHPVAVTCDNTAARAIAAPGTDGEGIDEPARYRAIRAPRGSPERLLQPSADRC